MLLSFCVEDVGKVIACAPSNEAADNLAEAIYKLNERFRLQRKVLRVLARNREFQSIKAANDDGEY